MEKTKNDETQLKKSKQNIILDFGYNSRSYAFHNSSCLYMHFFATFSLPMRKKIKNRNSSRNRKLKELIQTTRKYDKK